MLGFWLLALIMPAAQMLVLALKCCWTHTHKGTVGGLGVW